MKEITIYRVEKTDAGHGMWYNNNQKLSPIDYAKFKDAPMPFEKEYAKDGKNWFCGTTSFKQFSSWFPKEDLEVLVNDFGFSVYKMVSTEYQLQENQILYTLEGLKSKEDFTQEMLSM